jgi:hypothetical protein
MVHQQCQLTNNLIYIMKIYFLKKSYGDFDL